MRAKPFQKKAAIIFTYLKEHSLLPEERNELKGEIKSIGFSRQALDNWITGTPPRRTTLVQLSHKVADLVQLEGRGNEIEDRATFLKDVGVMKLGELLGLKRGVCRKAIDQQLGRVHPTFSIFSIEEDSCDATWNALSDKEGGYYKVYRAENSEIASQQSQDKSKVLIMPLAIRYKLHGSKPMSGGHKKIRAKLSIPSFMGGTDLYEYDGHVTRQDTSGFFHWMFQSRREDSGDLVYLITGGLERRFNASGQKPRRFIFGTMHSRNQDRNATGTSWPIIMERIENLQDEVEHLKNTSGVDLAAFDDDDSYFMKATPALVGQSETPEHVRREMGSANQWLSISTFQDCGDYD